MTGSPSSPTITIWHAANSPADPGLVENLCESWLDEPDRQRASLFKRATTRNQHVIGRGLSRRMLAGDDIDPQSIQFGVEPHGKPIVQGPKIAERPFNVTHTDGLVMCCVGNDHHRTVGIDVERLGRRTDPEIADRYFSDPEIKYLNACATVESRRRTFLRIWTLKESFIKAIGTGLTMPLSDFAFEQIESETPRVRLLNPTLADNLCWKFHALEPRPGFIAALAVATERHDMEVGYKLVRFEETICDGC